ncbi:MAG: VOC family protein [Candidatus Bipolaricaulota bacterium]|nr:VOC family protein [Candidatus Bipolaricaulota bacterium]
MAKKGQVNAGITFFYYKDIEPAASFYADILEFSLVDDQGWAKIFQINGSAFMGVVAGEKGFCRVQDENAVLLTIVVDDVRQWYEYLEEREVDLVTEIQDKDDIGIRCFFLKDPGGYSLEIQQFLKPGLANIFKK